MLRNYIRHRHAREQQIVDYLLGHEPSSAHDIAADIYRGVAEALLRAAADSVLAHLVKLEEDGRAERVGGRRRLAPVPGRGPPRTRRRRRGRGPAVSSP